jgi:hypothetical protein
VPKEEEEEEEEGGGGGGRGGGEEEEEEGGGGGGGGEGEEEEGGGGEEEEEEELKIMSVMMPSFCNQSNEIRNFHHCKYPVCVIRSVKSLYWSIYRMSLKFLTNLCGGRSYKK